MAYKIYLGQYPVECDSITELLGLLTVVSIPPKPKAIPTAEEGMNLVEFLNFLRRRREEKITVTTEDVSRYLGRPMRSVPGHIRGLRYRLKFAYPELAWSDVVEYEKGRYRITDKGIEVLEALEKKWRQE